MLKKKNLSSQYALFGKHRATIENVKLSETDKFVTHLQPFLALGPFRGKTFRRSLGIINNSHGHRLTRLSKIHVELVRIHTQIRWSRHVSCLSLSPNLVVSMLSYVESIFCHWQIEPMSSIVCSVVGAWCNSLQFRSSLASNFQLVCLDRCSANRCFLAESGNDMLRKQRTGTFRFSTTTQVGESLHNIARHLM